MSRDAADIAAEQALLGAVLTAPEIAGPALLEVPSRAWWNARNRMLADLLADRLRRGAPIDLAAVLGDVLDRGGPHRDQAGPWLFGLTERAFYAANAPEHAARIREVAGRRNLALDAAKLTQRLEEGWERGDVDDLAVLTSEMREACDEADASLVAAEAAVPPTLADLLAEQDEHDWLVPGLLERGDRTVLTGAEGLGKSEAVGMLACCLSAGVHPWTGAVLGAGNYEQRVLVVDFENSRAQTRRRYRRIAAAVDRARQESGWDRTPWADVMRIEIRPEGTNLLDAREVAWLQRLVGACAPDLLVIGPLYKLHQSNINDESAARELVAVLDGLRVKHQTAVLTEAHAGHAEDGRGARRMRPSGSSLFMRWPEFGYGLRRAKDDDGEEHPTLVDVVAWRGSREERAWPRQLIRGRPGSLPWEPTPDYWHQQLRVVEGGVS